MLVLVAAIGQVELALRNPTYKALYERLVLQKLYA
jgi:hypothetical protein